MLGFDDANRNLYNAALRVYGVFWIFYFWVVFALFDAQITSEMTLESVTHRVQTFKDVLAEPGIKV